VGILYCIYVVFDFSMNAKPQPIPPIILPEVLGFSPHLLLDDIVDIANDAIRLTVDAMEGFIIRWAQERADTAPEGWDGKAESEMGIISLQTLLESHTDIAFDALEAWSLRNIFALDPELPIVLPHHRSLNLHEPDAADAALMHRIEDLRIQLTNVRPLLYFSPYVPPALTHTLTRQLSLLAISQERRLKRLLTRAVRKSAIQRRRAERRLAELATFSATQQRLSTTERFERFYHAVSTLAPPDPDLSKLVLQNPGKREWEVGEAGYTNWAVGQLLKRTNVGEGLRGSRADPEAIKTALEAMDMDVSH